MVRDDCHKIAVYREAGDRKILLGACRPVSDTVTLYQVGSDNRIIICRHSLSTVMPAIFSRISAEGILIQQESAVLLEDLVASTMTYTVP